MKVSIVIPAYNEEAYIEATLRAALAQDYPDFEVIVVDNGSIDKTVEKVRQFPRAKLVEEKRSGVQFAREAGRRAATGELIANLDADCVAPPDWLSKSVRYFDVGQLGQSSQSGTSGKSGKSRKSPVVAVTGPYDYYDASPSMRSITFLGYRIRNLTHKFLYLCFGLGGVIGGNCVMRADALQEIGGYDTSIVFYGDDTDTGNRLAKHGKVLFRNTLTVGSSARRFRRIGLLKLTWQYMRNYFLVFFHKKEEKKKRCENS